MVFERQCGFRKNRSTIDHLVRFESFVRNALIKGEHVVSILFDLEKAYDTTWKHGILLDLKNLGFTGNLPLFISNFLTDRNFQVHIGLLCQILFLKKWECHKAAFCHLCFSILK